MKITPRYEVKARSKRRKRITRIIIWFLLAGLTLKISHDNLVFQNEVIVPNEVKNNLEKEVSAEENIKIETSHHNQEEVKKLSEGRDATEEILQTEKNHVIKLQEEDINLSEAGAAAEKELKAKAAAKNKEDEAKAAAENKEAEDKAVNVNKGYNIAKKFKQADVHSNVDDTYITLWLHQVHSWFAEDEKQTTVSKVKAFIIDAKRSGFTQLMFDLAWAWTEREAHGDVQIDSFHKGDVMSAACEIGISLHIVITMRELPPWLEKLAQDDKTMYDFGSNDTTCNIEHPQTTGPSVAHPEVWKFAAKYLESTSELLLAKYGQCIVSISPSFNNEYETRYTQTWGEMRDYSASGIESYKHWQVEKGFSSSMENSVVPPDYPCHEICDPVLDKGVTQWLGYREEFLSERYIELCKIVKKINVGKESNGISHYHPDCLLHIGEIFSSTDSLNSNLLFKLAKSQFVDHLVMDSNMALFGAPSSPSIVGVLVSAAQAYGKSIHYEAATERILTCDNNGKLKSSNANLSADKGAALLFQSGIARGLEAGVHSIGVTNLCAPGSVGKLLSQATTNDTHTKGISLKRASSFKPTSVIFVPYRVFYAYNFVISGSTCSTNKLPCWHESFDEIPTFGHGSVDQLPGTCNVDTAQHSLLRIWDNLRTRHPQVAVIAEPEQLTDDLLQSAAERVFLRFPCVMNHSTWNFFEGEKWLTLFQEKNKSYPFSEVVATMPGHSCS